MRGPRLDPLRLELLRLVLRRVDEPVVREREDELLREDEPRVVELLRVPPVAVFAACWAAFAACSKSFRMAVLNLPVSRRASETNFPRPLYRVLVPLAASRPAACLRRSVSAFCALVRDWFSRFRAAGSLKLAPLRDEDRVDFRAWGTRSPQTRKRDLTRA